MAVTGIWKIETRLDQVIRYICNEEKTFNSEYGKEQYHSLHNVWDYEDLELENEKQLFSTGINCSVETAYEEMKITKNQYHKETGILGFHAFQSFREGEVTPELAHQIGIRLAQEMWGDRFEVVVSTHLNTNHIHNHFVINSVSFSDGKKYYDNRSSYAELRKLSDLLCEEYGLSVLSGKTCRKSRINYANYYKNYIGRDNYYTITKRDIDRAIGQAATYQDFERLLKIMNYEITYRYNKISIRRQPYKKNIRIERIFGEDYSINRIQERILEEHTLALPFMEEFSLQKRKKQKRYKSQTKARGIYALYIHYCYLLKVIPKKYPYHKLSPSVLEDAQQLDKISEEMRFLAKNQIKSGEKFLELREDLNSELNNILDERSKLWYRYKKCFPGIEKKKIQSRIEATVKIAKQLREEIQICDRIAERIPIIQEKIEENERKEVNKDEYIK